MTLLPRTLFVCKILEFDSSSFMNEWTTDSLLPASLLNSITNRLDKSFEQTERHQLKQEAYQYRKDEFECHRSFKTSTYEDYKNINSIRLQGTCQLALNHDLYRSWRDSVQNDYLVVTADPGCGKSVFARSLVDLDLKTSEEQSPAVCYFFFKDNDAQNTLSIALCALLHQLFCMKPRLICHALKEWQQHGTSLKDDASALWRVLVEAMSDPYAGNIVFVINALDECQEIDQRRLMNMLGALKRETNTKASSTKKFLITCRPYGEIKNSFDTAIGRFASIHVRGEDENDQINGEINLVIRHRVKDLAKTLNSQASVATRLEEQLLGMEHRTYLWLHLAMSDIEVALRHSLRPHREDIPRVPSSETRLTRPS